MNNLIWKQWRESRFHLSIFSLWMILAVCYSIAYELGHQFQAVVGSFSSSAMLYSVVAAIVLAARAAVGERTDGTLSFTASLPISLRRVAAVRIVGAMVTLVIPILIAALILAASMVTGLVEQAEPRNPDAYTRMLERPTGSLFVSLEQLASVTAIAAFGGVQLLLVLSLCGLWLRTQGQVGVLGPVIALVFILAAGVLWTGARWPTGQLLYGAILPQSLVIHWGYGEATGGYTDHELARYRWVALGTAIPLLLLLTRCFVIWYVMPISKKAKPIRNRISMSSIHSFLPMPLPHRWVALIWLELRQSVPVAACGLLLAVAITIAGQWMEGNSSQDFGMAIRSGLPHSVFFVGMLWAVVVGAGLFSTDLDSRLGSFRRTRPISPTIWFWNKYFVGLFAVIATLDGMTILVSWSASRTSGNSGMSYAYIACFPIIHAFMYSLAVLGTCMFRRPLIGGILAILCYTIGTIVVSSFPGTMQFEPVDIYNKLLSTERAGNASFARADYLVVYGFFVVSTIFLPVISSRLARPLVPVIGWFPKFST